MKNPSTSNPRVSSSKFSWNNKQSPNINAKDDGQFHRGSITRPAIKKSHNKSLTLPARVLWSLTLLSTKYLQEYKDWGSWWINGVGPAVEQRSQWSRVMEDGNCGRRGEKSKNAWLKTKCVTEIENKIS